MAYKFIISVSLEQSREKHPVGQLILGMVARHRDLTRPGSYTFGGGSYHIDNENKTITLDDWSADFGPAQFADRDWKYIECDSDFEGYKVTYQYPNYCSNGSEHAGELVDVTPLLKFCL